VSPILWAESFLTLIEIFLYLFIINQSCGETTETKEACQLLSISYSTLLRWIREGKIRVVTTEGGKYRIPYSEIKKYLEKEGREEGCNLCEGVLG
jgi:DNA binding domain, excisionase family